MATRTRDRGVARALDALADAARTAAQADGSGEALDAIAAAARIATGADVAIVRVVDRASGRASARAVSARSAALAALLEGTSLGVEDLPGSGVRALADAADAAVAALRGGGAAAVSVTPDATLVTLPLGQPRLGVLQLAFPADSAPDEDEVARLTTFAVRAAQALRVGRRTRALESE